jgi:hypothetical protein
VALAEHAVDQRLAHAVVANVEEAHVAARATNLGRDGLGPARRAGEQRREVDDGDGGEALLRLLRAHARTRV